MGAPMLPMQVPDARWEALTIRTIGEDPGIEGIPFYFLADTQEWIVEDADDRDLILASYPGARFFQPNSVPS